MRFKKVQKLAIASIASVFVGCASVDNSTLVSEADLTADEMKAKFDRITEEEFKDRYPEYKYSDFSGFGQLVKTKDSMIVAYCSQQLLKPGNILVTAKHCISNDPEVKYWTIYKDVNDNMQVNELDVHGNGYLENVYIPNIEYLNPSASARIRPRQKFSNKARANRRLNKEITTFGGDDIAFITLDSFSINSVIPLAIADYDQEENERVKIAGSSDLVRKRDENDDKDIGFSLSGECNGKPIIRNMTLVSNCHANTGDSGGAIYSIKNGQEIYLTHIIDSGLHDNRRAAKLIERLYGFEAAQSNGYSLLFATSISKFGEFCRMEIGGKYCKAFPGAKEGGIPEGVKPKDYIKDKSYRYTYPNPTQPGLSK